MARRCATANESRCRRGFNQLHFLPTMLRRSFLSVLVLGLSSAAFVPAQAADDAALREKVAASLAKGRAFLRQQQKESGAWSLEDVPGLTALAVDALLPAKDEASKAAAAKGLDYIR